MSFHHDASGRRLDREGRASKAEASGIEPIRCKVCEVKTLEHAVTRWEEHDGESRRATGTHESSRENLS